MSVRSESGVEPPGVVGVLRLHCGGGGPDLDSGTGSGRPASLDPPWQMPHTENPGGGGGDQLPSAQPSIVTHYMRCQVRHIHTYTYRHIVVYCTCRVRNNVVQWLVFSAHQSFTKSQSMHISFPSHRNKSSISKSISAQPNRPPKINSSTIFSYQQNINPPNFPITASYLLSNLFNILRSL